MTIVFTFEWEWVAAALAYLLIGTISCLVYQTRHPGDLTGWQCFGWITLWPAVFIIYLIALFHQ